MGNQSRRHPLVVLARWSTVLSICLCAGLIEAGKASTKREYPTEVQQAGRQALKLVGEGYFEEALPLWRQVFNWQKEHFGGDDPRTLRSLRNLAAVELAAGKTEEASKHYAELRNRLIHLEGPNSPDSIQAALDLARTWRTLTQFEAAERLTRQTLGLLNELTNKDYLPGDKLAEAHELLGTIAHEQGRYAQAAEAHQAALSLRLDTARTSQTKPTLSIASNRANLAQAFLRQGKYVEALALQRQALSEYQSLNGVDTRRQQATVLPNIALSLNLLGQTQLSLMTLRQAVALRSQLQGVNHPETARLLLNLGALEAELGNPATALEHYRVALTTLRTHLGPQHLSTAFALQRMAELARSEQQPERARQWGKSALEIRSKQLEPDHPDLATTWLGIGLSDLALGAKDQGISSIRQSVEIRRKSLGAHHPYTGMATLMLGLSLWDGDSQEEATQHLLRAIQANDSFLRNQAPLLPVRERKRILASIQQSRNAFYSLATQGPRGRDLALTARLNLHGRLEEIEKRQHMLLRQNPQNPGASQMLEAVSAQLDQEQLKPAVRQRLEQQHRSLIHTIERKIKSRNAGVDLQEVTAHQVAEAMPASSALVEFIQIQPVRFRGGRLERLGEDRLTALVLTPEKSVQSLDLGPATTINKEIWKALAETQRASNDSEAAWTKVGDLVLRPLMPILGNRKTWFISPDGELHRVPFAAIGRREPTGLVLYGDKYKIRLLTSGRDLLATPPPVANKKQNPLVVADPNFDASPFTTSTSPPPSDPSTDWKTVMPETWRKLRWSRLPGSRREGESLQKLLKAKLLTDTNATSSALRATQSPEFLHVASHGAFLPATNNQEISDLERQRLLEGKSRSWDDPMQRGVVILSGANRTDLSEQEEGYLTAAETSLLKLEGTRLATLSACDTGKGTIEVGDGVYGLRRALAVAGAQSSLLSLWKVDDRATMAFMKHFYEAIAKGETPEKALKRAQVFMRSHERIEWRNPYAWAAFQLYGRSW